MKFDCGSDSKKKRRILPDSTPALRIRGHLYYQHEAEQVNNRITES